MTLTIVALCATLGESQALLALLRDRLGAAVDWQGEVATMPDRTRVSVLRMCPARCSLFQACDVLLGRCPEHGDESGCAAFHDRERGRVANWQPAKGHHVEPNARAALLAMFSAPAA